jgi:hypothetical protein
MDRRQHCDCRGLGQHNDGNDEEVVGVMMDLSRISLQHHDFKLPSRRTPAYPGQRGCKRRSALTTIGATYS